MRNKTHTVRMSLIFLAGASLIACAPFLENDRSWQSSPDMRIVQPELRPSIGYYESAVTAINTRRYALALEYLQTARAQKPDDVRVLTAFGVVYDKLGRFDLSARYYAQAAALEPQSKIIAADLDYSRRLQGVAAVNPASRIAEIAPMPVEPMRPGIAAQLAPSRIAAMPSTPMRIFEERASILQPGIAVEAMPMVRTGTTVKTRSVFLTGHPLTIVDASGRNDSGKSVRSYLSGLGWTLAGGEDPKLPARAQTVIVYRESMITVAKALARTLSLPMRLTVSNDIQGLQLVLGGDISSVRLAGRLPRPQHRQLASAATNTERQE